MIDNDKAAIAGKLWEPGLICSQTNFPIRDGTTEAFIYCDRCRAKIHWLIDGPPDQIHQMAAPDMSLPANYMRALERIRDGIGYWKLERDFHCDTGVDLYALTLVGGIPVQGGWLAHPGSAVISALAGLYDAEHPEGGQK
jgi:hypothetical protein